ncbi:MAG: hypothetical protein KDD67_09805 [Ignavibacteriae bacterium]|nr:hypothetical protein [Ignavibacteriota bacterium]
MSGEHEDGMFTQEANNYRAAPDRSTAAWLWEKLKAAPHRVAIWIVRPKGRVKQEGLTSPFVYSAPSG